MNGIQNNKIFFANCKICVFRLINYERVNISSKDDFFMATLKAYNRASYVVLFKRDLIPSCPTHSRRLFIRLFPSPRPEVPR